MSPLSETMWLRDLDFARGKASYRGRRRRLCKILTFPLHCHLPSFLSPDPHMVLIPSSAWVWRPLAWCLTHSSRFINVTLLPFLCSGFHTSAKIGTCQGLLPSASTETEPGAASAPDLQYPEGDSGWRVRHSVFHGNWWNQSLDN